MTENKEYMNVPQYQDEDELEIDLMEYARKLWAARKLLLKVAGIAAIVGVVIAFSIPKQYTAQATLSPESGKGGGSSLSGMAAMLGIGGANMGGDANALNISMTSDIVASTPFVLELFDTQVKTLDGETDTTLVAYLETESAPWWGTLMSLPGKAIGGVMSLFSDKEEEEEKPLNPFQLTPKQMGKVNAIKKIIMADVDKKTGMTKISITLQDPLVAATMAETVVEKLQKYITEYKTSKAQEDCKYWEQLYEERKKEYYEAQEKYAKYSDNNQGVVLQSVRIEQERLQNEQSLAFQLFNQVSTQLQMSRAKLQEEKPAFAILEPASVPLHPSGTSRKIILVGVVFLALAAAAAWILFGQDLWKNLKEGLSESNETKEA
ncbi:MAG: chain-length determining protein [Bacteroides sp.]|nr:chain-length determining protein [Bacteroides sp.]